MAETLLSVGIDIGTSTTQLVISRLTLENRANPFSVPKVAIAEREGLYRSDIHFTPLLSDTVIDAQGVRTIVEEEYRKSGFAKGEIATGAVIITGETARKENAREVLSALSEFAGDFVVATAGPDLESILAARGAGADEYSGEKYADILHFDIGGGTADIAVISLGGTVVSASIKIAGDDFDEALVRYMRKKHNLLIGERTAEDIKIKIGSAYKRPEPDYMDVRGRNLVTGLPKTVKVSSEETEEALKEPTLQIVEAIHSVLERTPPELAADIADRGIVLTGGGSLLRGLEELISERTGINTMTAEDPMTAVAIGTGKYVEFLGGYKDEI